MEIRIWLPFTWVGLKYCLSHPKSFVIGVYGYKRFLQQRDLILDQRKQINDLENKVIALTTKNKEISTQLSALKRKMMVKFKRNKMVDTSGK